jgi:hypothetical protein
MAMRRDPREQRDMPDQTEDNRLVEFPKDTPQTGVRPEMIEIGRQVIAKRRRLLERLAAYDRGDDPGR